MTKSHFSSSQNIWA